MGNRKQRRKPQQQNAHKRGMRKAAVTNLERCLGFARDRPLPEYDLPHWVTPPAARATAQRLLEQHRTEAAALDRFRRLRQTIASRTHGGDSSAGVPRYRGH